MSRPPRSGCVVAVVVVPRGGRDAIDGPDDEGRLRCRVAAPPAEGAANLALVRLMADVLGVPRSAVTIASGQTSRRKRVAVEGVAAEDLQRRWPGLRVEAR